jgi:hypothetical protein
MMEGGGLLLSDIKRLHGKIESLQFTEKPSVPWETGAAIRTKKEGGAFTPPSCLAKIL